MSNDDTPIERERIEDRLVNIVQVAIWTTSDCDPEQDECTMSIIGIIGSLSISPDDCRVGIDDVSLIRDAIANEVDLSTLPDEGATFITLKESGEWEDVFWHKYYVVDRIARCAQ